MSTTKFKYLDEKLGLGATKSFFPFYDNEKDKDFKVRLDVLVDLIAGQVTSVGKSVFELSGITNSGNNYSSSYTLASYITEGIYIFQPNVNSSGNAFLNVSSLGSLPIKKFDGTSLINVDDLKAVNTYLLVNKTTYWLLAGGLAGGSGGVSTFSALTDSPYDNILLASALNSKQDRINGIVSGCEITVETFAGIDTNKRIRVSKGAAATNTWYISPNEYSKLADTVSSEITLCVTGGDFKYYDVVADNTGAITIHEGTPSTSPSHYVVNPLFEVLLGFVTVGDAVIEEPTPIITSLTKKNQYFGVLSGSQTLNCENKDFAIFYFDVNGTALTLSFSNYYNLVNGVLFIRVLSETTIDLPFVSYEFGQSILSKVLKVGNYAVYFQTSVGNFYFQFNNLAQASQAQVEASFDNTNQTTPVVLEQTSALTPFNAWWLVQKIKAFFSTTANQTDSTNKRFVTDAEKVVIGNTSNTNTGDETAPRIGALLTPDTSPLDTDSVVSWDGTLLMKTTWLNIKSFLVTYFDTLYLKLTGGTLSGALNYAPSVSLTGATPAIGAAASNNITITSTTTITGFDSIAEGAIRRVKFAAITPLTHSANLDLPTSANITTAVGDEAVFRSNGAGSWKCISYLRKDGSALLSIGGSFQTLATEVTGSLTAAIDKYYINTASATYTDPTGVQGKGFIVLVRAGTATIGGTAYTTGIIYRYYNSGAWSNIMFRDFATITGDVIFTSGVGSIANNAVTNAKAAQMAANTIKANNTGSTANAADITTDQLTAMMEIAVSVGTTGIITAMTSATYKYIRLTSASATGLGGIVAPSSSYKDLYIWNDTGVTLTLYHNYSSEATAANRILCGANRSWANNTMLHLKYDVTESRWCTVAQDGNTFRALLAGSGTRIVQADSTGQEQAVITTLDIDFTGAQQTSATTASWTGVNEVNIAGLQQGQLYIDVSGGYRYECHRNDYCSRTPVINVETFTTNSIYPIFEVTGTSGTFAEDSAYVLNNASLVTMSLPSTGTQGKVIVVNGKGAGGWKITVPNTQQIVGGATNTTTAGSGYIEATGGTKQYAAVTLKCITGGTSAVWEIVCINPATTLTIA